MSNRTTLAQLEGMKLGEVANLPIAHLAMLLEDVEIAKKQATKADNKLRTAIQQRFGEKARQARLAEGKDTGRIRIEEDDHVILCDSPKKISWDQDLLRVAADIIGTSWGEDPLEYMTVKFGVPEKRYENWPERIRRLFEPARTVDVGKPSFVIEEKAEVA